MRSRAKLILKGISEESGQPFKREIRTLDEVRESGQYTLVGYNVSEEEGLPPAEYDDCNYCFIEALLSVTRNSSSSGFVQKETIGQTITISNREDGGTNIYNRSWSKGKNNEEWTPWLMMLRGDISVVAPSNDISEKISIVADGLENEVKRAKTAEDTLQCNIESEAANAMSAHNLIKDDIAEQSNRITQTEINLCKTATVRFDRIEENEATINAGEIESSPSAIVYYKPANKFVAADTAGAYWDTWSGMDAYMSGGAVRKDKIYICGDKAYIPTDSHLRLLDNSHNPLGLSTTRGIEELIAIYTGDEQPHTLGIRQVVKSSGRFVIADLTLGINHYIDAGTQDSYPQGIKEYWYRTANNGRYYIIYALINWDLINGVAFSTDTPAETFIVAPIPIALSVQGNSLLGMLQSLDYDITGIRRYNSDSIAEEFDIVWRDGTENTAILSDYNADILDYNNLAAKYNDYVQVVQVRGYDEMGEPTKRITAIKNV